MPGAAAVAEAPVAAVLASLTTRGGPPRDTGVRVGDVAVPEPMMRGSELRGGGGGGGMSS